MFCPGCGARVNEGARFCGSCGRAIGGARDGRPVTTEITTWRPATTPELGGPARYIATNRGLIKYFLFSVLTLGIYSFYFIYKLAQDMNTMCDDDDQKTGGLIAFILLNIVTFGIYGIYWWYRIADRVYLNAPRFGFAVTEKGSSFLLWHFLGFITFGIASLFGTHIVLKNVNSLARAYNRQHGFAR